MAGAINVLVEPEGHLVVALRDRFPAETLDVDWIENLAEEGGWAVISGDVRITSRLAERLAWHRSHLKGFFLAPSWSKLASIEKTARLLLWWPTMEIQECLVAPGAIFQLPLKIGSRLVQLRIA